MPTLRHPTLNQILEIGLVLAAVAPTAPAQGILQTVSITDPRPLAKASEIITARYGVPVSYEDLSFYAYDGDLSDPIALRASNPSARILPPRNSGLNIAFEQLQSDPRRPAPTASVARFAAGILGQHENNGNPGRFKLIETTAGLVIVPIAARNEEGAFVPDQSPLDRRISFPEADFEYFSALQALCKALTTASGKEVKCLGDLPTGSFRFGANNEIARDVLARFVDVANHHIIGIGSLNGPPSPRIKSAWDLTLDPSIDPPHTGSYRLSFRGVYMGPMREAVFQCVPPALDCAWRP